MLSNSFSFVVSLNGGIPTSNSYKMTPTLHQSKVKFETDSPLIISGAI